MGDKAVTWSTLRCREVFETALLPQEDISAYDWILKRREQALAVRAPMEKDWDLAKGMLLMQFEAISAGF